MQCEKVGHSLIFWVHVLLNLAVQNHTSKKAVTFCVYRQIPKSKYVFSLSFLKALFKFVLRSKRYQLQTAISKWCQRVPTQDFNHENVSIRFLTFIKYLYHCNSRTLRSLCLKKVPFACAEDKIPQKNRQYLLTLEGIPEDQWHQGFSHRAVISDKRGQ